MTSNHSTTGPGETNEDFEFHAPPDMCDGGPWYKERPRSQFAGLYQNTPGGFHRTSDGREYQIDKNGTRRRIK